MAWCSAKPFVERACKNDFVFEHSREMSSLVDFTFRPSLLPGFNQFKHVSRNDHAPIVFASLSPGGGREERRGVNRDGEYGGMGGVE